jgi:hypothetical protein
MPETDEPTEDLRTSATVAATVAARVIETTARDLGARRAEAARQDYAYDRGGTMRLGYDSLRQRAERSASRTEQSASMGHRAAKDWAEANAARETADLMNGTDPGRAAGSAAAKQPAVTPAAAPAPARAPGSHLPGAKSGSSR